MAQSVETRNHLILGIHNLQVLSHLDTVQRSERVELALHDVERSLGDRADVVLILSELGVLALLGKLRHISRSALQVIRVETGLLGHFLNRLAFKDIAALHAILQQLRQFLRHLAALDEVAAGVEVALALRAEFLYERIIEEEVYLALKQAIDILPPKIRTIFYLILERKTNAEIASLLGITEEAVKAYRKRGMKMLRIRLSNFWILALLIF